MILEYKECDRCHTQLRMVEVGGREVAYDLKADARHVCWDLPEDANLLVLDD